MAGRQFDTSVLIVGAGPVGLALACELGLRGIDCTMVEKRDGKLHVPKMSLVSAGSMEYCRRWGIARKVRSAIRWHGRPFGFVYMESLAGRELARIEVPPVEPGSLEWTPEGMCQCPQIFFDPILSERAGRLDKVTRLYNTSMEDFEQDGNGVAGEIEDMETGRRRTLRARYLVGCDGASSTVRERLGIELIGEGALSNSVNIFFRSAELIDLHDKGWARNYRPIGEEGYWAELIPIDGIDLWRLTVADDPRYEHDPQAALRRMAGMDFPHEIISTQLWERLDGVAASYGEGRVMLAGDSAHQSSPTGGVGMHTGMEEAFNLAWKLEAMVDGWGGPRLPGSYEAERKPIAHRNVDLSTQTFRAMRGIPSAAEAVRQTAWRTTDVPTYAIQDHVRTCPAIADFGVIVDDGSPPLPQVSPKFAASTRPGARAPHAWLSERRSTIDLFGDGFVLMRSADADVDTAPLLDAAKSRNMPVREFTISDPDIVRLYEQPLVLVRPDYHVAWRGHDIPENPGAILDHVRGA